MKELLSRGCTLREASPGANRDWLITGSPESPRATLVAHAGTGDAKSDLRIESPCRMVVELKVFGEVGRMSAFNRGAIDATVGKSQNPTSFLWDLKAVSDGQADVVILVCGARQYDTARGEPWVDAGRTPEPVRAIEPGRVSSIILADLLPPRSEFQAGVGDFQRTWGDAVWSSRGRLVNPPALQEVGFDGQPRRAAEHRVILALWRPAPVVIPSAAGGRKAVITPLGPSAAGPARALRPASRPYPIGVPIVRPPVRERPVVQTPTPPAPVAVTRPPLRPSPMEAPAGRRPSKGMPWRRDPAPAAPFNPNRPASRPGPRSGPTGAPAGRPPSRGMPFRRDSSPAAPPIPSQPPRPGPARHPYRRPSR